MADNSLRTPGAGETIASDDIGGVKYQRVKIGVGADGTASDARPPDDGVAGANVLGVGPLLYNGATGDWQRGNTKVTLLASAARTATTSSAIQTNHNARGVILLVSVTVAGTGTLAPRVLDEDSLTTLGQFVAIATTGTYGYVVYPGATATTTGLSGAASAPLPRGWFAQMVKDDASSWTYSVTAHVIV